MCGVTEGVIEDTLKSGSSKNRGFPTLAPRVRVIALDSSKIGKIWHIDWVSSYRTLNIGSRKNMDRGKSYAFRYVTSILLISGSLNRRTNREDGRTR
jgi:hypothetical protein